MRTFAINSFHQVSLLALLALTPFMESTADMSVTEIRCRDVPIDARRLLNRENKQCAKLRDESGGTVYVYRAFDDLVFVEITLMSPPLQMTFVPLSDSMTLEMFKGAQSPVILNSYDWTPVEEIANGKAAGYMTRDSGDTVWRCFSHATLYDARGTWENIQKRGITVYCNQGDSHFSKSDIQSVMSDVKYY
jgi:hypothetical protein